jgi:CheY-like chemotaxis protein
MLAQLRQAFLDEMTIRCDEIEDLILELEANKGNQELFQELYRKVHSLKGSGGTHGLGVVTSICHHLENRLTESQAILDGARANNALDHVDLLRRVVACGGEGTDLAGIEESLAVLQKEAAQGRRAVLVAESSRAMLGLYKQALAALPLQVTCVDDGLVALQTLMHQRFDYVVLAGELKGLNGVAVAAALRASGGRNASLPIILVSSNRKAIPDHLHVQEVVARDQSLLPRLVEILGPRRS